MDPTGPIARRFPLVPRNRPACLPLPARARGLVELADTARNEAHLGIASTVINQAALLASDAGLPSLAREWCRRHAAAYLQACPLGGTEAVRALEPLVNLARLDARARRGADACAVLADLYQAVTNGTAVTIDSITVPEHLTASDDDRRVTRRWLWGVVIADGTRALTRGGRWQDAVAFLRQHRGIGNRMLDGRQVAVVARAVVGDHAGALQLLAAITPSEPWEDAVADCMAALCRRSPHETTVSEAEALIGRYEQLGKQPDLIVFRVRLALSIVDAAQNSGHAGLRALVSQLVGQVTEIADGYAAREVLEHDEHLGFLNDCHKQDLAHLVRACALGQAAIPEQMLADLSAAVASSEEVIMAGLL